MKLVLIDDMGKYVVECLNDEFEFVHNKLDGSNWFAQKTLASMFGVSVQSVSKRLNTYKKRIEANKNNSTKRELFSISLNLENSKKPVMFYNFKAVTWFAHVLNTQEAFDMLEWIDSSLNTMFNVATGQLDIDTRVDKLKKMQEVEELKSQTYLDASNLLWSVDKDKAKELFHLHKVHYHNALNCYDLLVSKDDWKNRYEVVDRQINGKIDNTRQLTF